MKLYSLLGYLRDVKRRRRSEAGRGQIKPFERWMDVMAKPQINTSSPHHTSDLRAPNPMKPPGGST